MINFIRNIKYSELVFINLIDFYPKGKRISLDINKWLNGFSINETQLREHIENQDWSNYKDAFIALHCSTITVPSWAYMLIIKKLTPYTNRIVIGDIDAIKTILLNEIISSIDEEKYKNKHVLISGCNENNFLKDAYIQLTQKLVLTATSIVYRKTCTDISLFKE